MQATTFEAPTMRRSAPGGGTHLHAAAVSRWTNGKATFANITSKVNISGSKSTGALVGYGATGSKLVAENCVNYGNFDCSDQVGGIIGYVNSANYEIKDNINVGEISVTGGAKNTIALIGYNKAIGSVESGMFSNNYALAAGETVVAYAGDAAANPATFAPAAETAAVAFTAEQLAAGEIAYLKEIGFALK